MFRRRIILSAALTTVFPAALAAQTPGDIAPLTACTNIDDCYSGPGRPDYDKPEIPPSVQFDNRHVEYAIRQSLGMPTGDITHAAIARVSELHLYLDPGEDISIKSLLVLSDLTRVYVYGSSHTEGIVYGGAFHHGRVVPDGSGEDRFVHGLILGDGRFLPGSFTPEMDRFVPGMIFGDDFIPGFAFQSRFGWESDLGFAPGIIDGNIFDMGVFDELGSFLHGDFAEMYAGIGVDSGGIAFTDGSFLAMDMDTCTSGVMGTVMGKMWDRGMEGAAKVGAGGLAILVAGGPITITGVIAFATVGAVGGVLWGAVEGYFQGHSKHCKTKEDEKAENEGGTSEDVDESNDSDNEDEEEDPEDEDSENDDDECEGEGCGADESDDTGSDEDEADSSGQPVNPEQENEGEPEPLDPDDSFLDPSIGPTGGDGEDGNADPYRDEPPLTVDPADIGHGSTDGSGAAPKESAGLNTQPNGDLPPGGSSGGVGSATPGDGRTGNGEIPEPAIVRAQAFHQTHCIAIAVGHEESSGTTGGPNDQSRGHNIVWASAGCF